MKTTYMLGRNLEHDPRSLSYPAPTDVAVKTKTWRHYGAVLNQGQVGSCTGNAMAQSLNTAPLKVVGRTMVESDALAFYHQATIFDSTPGIYPPTDTGSSGLAVAKAAQQAGYITSYLHAFGLDHALQALMTGPVLVGTNWYEGMFNPSPSGEVTISGSVAGGHEYLIRGVNVTHKTVTCLNSWGSDWGIRGGFTMSFDTLGRLLSEQGDVVLPLRS